MHLFSYISIEYALVWTKIVWATFWAIFYKLVWSPSPFFLHKYKNALVWTKIVWATFWAIFSQTRLVTLHMVHIFQTPTITFSVCDDDDDVLEHPGNTSTLYRYAYA
jgi:hypothetical protein